MILEYMSWTASMLVLIGYWFNSERNSKLAAYVWIIADMLWIIWDIAIANWAHIAMSMAIIALNARTIYQISRDRSSPIGKCSAPKTESV